MVSVLLLVVLFKFLKMAWRKLQAFFGTPVPAQSTP